jgi:uncharacterized protein (TIGR02145 family)
MMRRIHFLLVLVIGCKITIAQVPESFNYQAIPRNASGGTYPDQAMNLRISILSGSPTGSSVYTETFSQTTTSLGLLNLQIGKGTPGSGSFATINWSTGSYYLKVEIDAAGGTSYVVMGTTQLLSVPYAFYSKTAGNGSLWAQSGSNIYYNTGNAGIGTNTPSTYIHAHGAPVASRGQLSLSSPAGQDIFLSFYEADNFKSYLWYNIIDQDLRLQNFTAGDLNLNPYGGKVGIGTNSPGFTLDVSGDINFTGAFNRNGNPFALPWANITGKPTTLSGYGITDAVNITDNQTIAGNKTFTGTTTVIAPVNATDAANKAYVDAIIKRIEDLEGLVVYGTKISDVDGNLYNIVTIGNQVWMAENLKTSKLNDRSPIPLTTSPSDWYHLVQDTGYCWYNNDSGNKASYGALYNYYTVKTGKLCPVGWHVPNLTEWTELINYLGGTKIAGEKMKETGTTHWYRTGSRVTNESGFTGLPGGMRTPQGGYEDLRAFGYWWGGASGIYGVPYLILNDGNGEARIMNYDAKQPVEYLNGFSVRCLKD